MGVNDKNDYRDQQRIWDVIVLILDDCLSIYFSCINVCWLPVKLVIVLNNTQFPRKIVYTNPKTLHILHMCPYNQQGS